MSDYIKSDDSLDGRIYDFCAEYTPYIVLSGLWLFWALFTVHVNHVPTSELEWMGILTVGFIMMLITALPVICIIGIIMNITFNVYWAIRDGIDELRYRQGR